MVWPGRAAAVKKPTKNNADAKKNAACHPTYSTNSAELLPELAEIEEESQGLKAVVRRHAEATERFELGDPSVLWDLNTPEQYQQALDSAT